MLIVFIIIFYFCYRDTIFVNNKMFMVEIPPTHSLEDIYGVKVYVYVCAFK